MKDIPFTKPWINKKELQSALNSDCLCSLGNVSRKLEKYLEKKLKVKRALLVGSGTQALEIIFISLNLKRGDEVICPSYAFVSVANSIIKAGGKAVFVDIEPESLGLNPFLVEKAINSKTKAVVLIHYGGIPACVEKIKEICVKYKIKLIEDAAHTFLVKDNRKYLGTFGEFGCFSFHYSKNVTSGEGGLLVIPGNENIVNECEEIRSFGTDKESFLRKDVDKYEWQRIGGSYFMTDIQAMLLKSQIDKYSKILFRRKKIYNLYYQKLKKLKGIKVKISQHPFNSNFHMFWLLCRSEEERNSLLKILHLNGIQASFHFLPLHISPFVRKNPERFRVAGDLKTTIDISKKILRLPIFPKLRINEANFICSKILNFYKI